MQSKVLAALIDRSPLSASALAAATDIKRNTVTTVLERFRHALAVEDAAVTGRKGRPEKLYSVKPEWVDILRRRTEVAAAPPPIDRLESVLGTSELASFAAVDPTEESDTRARMIEMTRLQARGARGLLERAGSGVDRHVARQRIARAEQRVAMAGATVAERGSEEENALHGWWAHWVERVSGLARQFGSELIGAEPEARGMLMVLDLASRGDDRVTRDLVNACEAHLKPALCVPMGRLSAAQRQQFITGFRELALDPIARHAALCVTLDSTVPTSARLWSSIDSIGRPDSLGEMLKVASGALMEVAVSLSSPAEMEPAKAYYDDFIVRAVDSSKNEGSLWGVLGTPHVLDLKENGTFQATAERQLWNYHSRPERNDLDRIASSTFELSE